MTGPAVSPESIIYAAAAHTHIPVGEDLQQRQQFSADQGLQAHDITQLLPSNGDGARCFSAAASGHGLAVQVKVIQAGAAVWLPAQQGRDWPVNILLEVSVFSAVALPAGADVTVVADAVSAAQRVVLAHGSPLPLRLQSALAPSTQRAAKASTTAFTAPRGRRSAHIEVPKAGVWVKEHFGFPLLTFQKHSDLHPLSLIFAASVKPTGGGAAADAGNVAATSLLPCTVSMRSTDEVAAALRVLRLPPDIFDRISVCRDMLSHASGRFTPWATPDPFTAGYTHSQLPKCLNPIMAGSAQHAREMSRKTFLGLELQHEDAEMTIGDQEAIGDQGCTGASTPRTSMRSVRTDCGGGHVPVNYGHTSVQVSGLPLCDSEAVGTGFDGGPALTTSTSQPPLRSLRRERERQLHRGGQVRMHAGLAGLLPNVAMGALGVTLQSKPSPRWPGMHAAPVPQAVWRSILRLPTLEACEVMLSELFSEEH